MLNINNGESIWFTSLVDCLIVSYYFFSATFSFVYIPCLVFDVIYSALTRREQRRLYCEFETLVIPLARQKDGVSQKRVPSAADSAKTRQRPHLFVASRGAVASRRQNIQISSERKATTLEVRAQITTRLFSLLIGLLSVGHNCLTNVCESVPIKSRL